MPNQYSYSREQIRRWAREGALTPERIAAIEAAAKKGNVSRDDSAPAVESQTAPQPPQVAGTEIRAREIPVHLPWWW
jgi:DNA-binding transcriptional regulator YdaS (Cro superfamily)